MGRRTYTYRTSSFVVGVLILIFLFLLSLSFLAGYYLGRVSAKSYPSPMQVKPMASPVAKAKVGEGEKTAQSKEQPSVENKASPERNSAEERKVPPQKKTLEPKKKAAGNYLLQVAALRNGESARKLSQELSSRGYPAKVEFRNGFYRVLVGPFDLSRARQVRKELVPLLRKLRVRIRSVREILIRRVQ